MGRKASPPCNAGAGLWEVGATRAAGVPVQAAGDHDPHAQRALRHGQAAVSIHERLSSGGAPPVPAHVRPRLGSCIVRIRKPIPRLAVGGGYGGVQSWNPMWSMSTVLTGLLSFMLETTSTTGRLAPPLDALSVAGVENDVSKHKLGSHSRPARLTHASLCYHLHRCRTLEASEGCALGNTLTHNRSKHATAVRV